MARHSAPLDRTRAGSRVIPSTIQMEKKMQKRILNMAAALAALVTLTACSSNQANSVDTAQSQDSQVASSAPKAEQNIVEVAIGNGNFTTLVAAVKAAGLAETLMGAGPFTVFAPTDAAFAKLPKGTVESLLQDKEKLASILTYHVLPANVGAAAVIAGNGARPATVNGQTLDITVRDGKVFVNGANVVSADVTASNGVIHVIDEVLMPKAAPAAGPKSSPVVASARR